MKNFTFSEEEKKRIEKAVADLEVHSSGEIVPFFTEASDDYPEARFISSTLFVFGGVLLLYPLARYFPEHFFNPIELALFFVVLMLLGLFFPVVFPAMKRFLVPTDTHQERVRQRAFEVFVREEVFKTRERTGILIFMSRLEHQVLVLADSGINQKVKPEDWKDVVETISKAIKEKHMTDGIVSAIGKCEKLLLNNGFDARPDNFNELPNTFRTE